MQEERLSFALTLALQKERGSIGLHLSREGWGEGIELPPSKQATTFTMPEFLFLMIRMIRWHAGGEDTQRFAASLARFQCSRESGPIEPCKLDGSKKTLADCVILHRGWVIWLGAPGAGCGDGA